MKLFCTVPEKFIFKFFVVLGLLISAFEVESADTYTWDPDSSIGPTHNWTSTVFWLKNGSFQGEYPNGSTDKVYFTALTGSPTYHIDMAGINPTINEVTLGGDGYYAIGTTSLRNQLRIEGTDPEIKSNKDGIINSNVFFGVNNTTIHVSSTRTLTMTGTITSSSGATSLSKTGSGNFEFSGATSGLLNVDIQEGGLHLTYGSDTEYSNALSGSGSLTWNSSSALTMSGVNTHTGSTTVITGTLSLSSTGSLENTSTISLTSTGTFEILGDKTIRNLGGTPATTVSLGSNNLTFSHGLATFQGTVTGTGGSLTIDGDSAYTLTGTNTYTGGTTMASGFLYVTTDANLGDSSGGLTFSGGTLKTQGTFSSSRPITLNASARFEVNDSTTLTLSGVMAGASGAGLIKTGAGALVSSATNTFTGGVTVSTGSLTLSGANSAQGDVSIASGASLTLSGSDSSLSSIASMDVLGTFTLASSAGNKRIHNLSGSGSVVLNDNTLIVNQVNSDLTFSGVISDGGNTGALTKIGSEQLTLSGTNTYTGETTVSAGTLVVSGSIPGNATLSAGTLQVTGSVGGNVTLTTGTLDVRGTVSGNVTVNGGTLKGTGTLGSGGNTVTNSDGVVAPGASIGTLTISGDYDQASTGNLEIEINGSGGTDLLSISGDATLAGEVTIRPLAGLYAGDSTYTFLTANSITGSFSTINLLKGITGSITYPSSTSAVFTVALPHLVLPVDKTALRGNARSIAEYLFVPNYYPSNPDLVSVYNTILATSDQNFPTALRRLGPTQFSAFPLVGLQTDVRLASGFAQNWKNYSDDRCCPKSEDDDDDDCERREDLSYHSIWIQPLGFEYIQRSYKQHEIQEQIKFNSGTYGGCAGFLTYLGEYFFIAAESGYTHSNLVWSRNAGNAKWDTLFFSPAVGWSSNVTLMYVDLLALGALNLYEVDRQIIFPGLNRIASNRHKSFDLLLRVDAGRRFDTKHWVIQPEFVCNFFMTFEEAYSETGANSLDLQVFANQEVYIRPEFTVRVGPHVCTPSLKIFPSIKLGWVSNIPTTNGIYKAKLRGETFPGGNEFPVIGFHRITNQLVAGVEFGMVTGGTSIQASFEGNYLDVSTVQDVKVRFDVWF